MGSQIGAQLNLLPEKVYRPPRTPERKPENVRKIKASDHRSKDNLIKFTCWYGAGVTKGEADPRSTPEGKEGTLHNLFDRIRSQINPAVPSPFFLPFGQNMWAKKESDFIIS